MMKQLIRNAKRGAARKSHIILGVTAIVGAVAEAVIIYQCSPKIHKTVDEHKKRVKDIDEDDIQARDAETVRFAKEMAKEAGPAVFVTALTIGCIAGCLYESNKKIVGLTEALASSQLLYSQTMKAVEERYGPKDAYEMRQHVSNEDAKEHEEDRKKAKEAEDEEIPAPSAQELELYLVYNAWSKQWFHSNKESLRKAANDINEMIYRDSDFHTLAEFYWAIDSPDLRVGPVDDEMGFYPDHNVSLNLHNYKGAPNGEPALVMDFVHKPVSYEAVKRKLYHG